MDSDRVTVVIPTRNRSSLLDRLLMCLSLVTEPELEVIVVDEGSEDDTPQVLAHHGGILPNLRAVRNDQPRGPSAARNQGLDLATSLWISWIDDDDLTSPDRFALQLRAIQRAGVRWAFAGRVDIDDDLNILGMRRLASADDLLARLLAFNVIPASGQGLLVETALAREVGGFDETLRNAEDWEFCIRLAERAPAVSVDAPLVGYRVMPGSLSSDPARMDAEIARVFEKHAALARRVGVRPDRVRVNESLMFAELQSGSRRRCLRRLFAQLRREPSLRRTAKAVLIMISPQLAIAQARRKLRHMPDQWRADAEAWLRPLTSGLQKTGGRSVSVHPRSGSEAQ